tara:strand:+ start:173 stop:406 length:234 start_codon:yes stop_codon:yes gene_type:complete
MKKTDNDKITYALKKTFNKSKIPKKIENLKIGDLKEWDSLGHVNLLLEIEKIFKLKFESKIFLSLDSIKKIKKHLPK